MSIRILAAILLVSCMSWSPTAVAQYDEEILEPFDEEQPRRRARQRQREDAPQCRKWCAADLNPCDPPSFKIADKRCDNLID